MANIESRTIRVADLIAKVRSGEFRVPRFQRSFVWRPDQVLKLLDSVRLRYPLGTLFVWHTPERYASFGRVGGVNVPQEQPPPPTPVGYVVDGHQRLSCLVGVLGLTDAEVGTLGGSERLFVVYYDLEKKQFVHAAKPADHLLPARYLLPPERPEDSDDALNNWVEERREHTERGSPERARWDQHRREAFSLQTTIGQTLIRYDEVSRASLQEVVDIFARVNRQGTPAKPEAVFAALSWKPDQFDFTAQAQATVANSPGFETLDTSVVLRALLCSLGESAYERGWERIQSTHGARLANQLESVTSAFGRALDFLRDDALNARNARAVPYALQVVLLTRFFELNPSPSAGQRERLRAWFWASSFGAVYGAAGSLMFDEHLKRAERLARGEDIAVLPNKPLLLPLPRRFHPRSARVRALHLFLASLHPLRPEDGEEVPEPLRNGHLDVRAVLTGDDSWRLGARILVGQGGGDPRRRLMAASAHPLFSMLLESHAIPQEAFSALERGQNERFITLRHQRLVELETEHARQFVEVPTTTTEDYEEAIIDTDDGAEDYI